MTNLPFPPIVFVMNDDGELVNENDPTDKASNYPPWYGVQRIVHESLVKFYVRTADGKEDYNHPLAQDFQRRLEGKLPWKTKIIKTRQRRQEDEMARPNSRT